LQKNIDSLSIDIRLLTAEDEPFLWEMLYQALFIPPGHPPLPREVLQNPELRCYVQGWGKLEDEGFLALDNGKPVGAVWIRLLTGDERGYGYIDDHTPELSIAILPEYRSRGIGGLLVSRLLSEIKPRYTAICLSVSTDNPAIRLYRRLGFDVVDAVSGSLKMVKRLNQ
jgi:ribosomal protein S18 acetylase RimI-like enzyme